MRKAGTLVGRCDSYYITPDGKRLRSRAEVCRQLGLPFARGAAAQDHHPNGCSVGPAQCVQDAPRDADDDLIAQRPFGGVHFKSNDK